MILLGSLTAARQQRLTQITFNIYSEWSSPQSMYTSGALENGVGASGGPRISPKLVLGNSVPSIGYGIGCSANIDLNSYNVSWANRYSYRLGLVNVYQIALITLYCDGAIMETQYTSGTYAQLTGSGYNFCGINLNPGNRNITSFGTGTYRVYPK